MWQFVQFRGNQYGLMQTAYSDDRYDPEKATRAAAHHLHDLYNEFHDWYLAIAAYNCGPGAIERAVERTGYADYWELRARHAIPVETSNYVPIILAMTIMAKNAPEYGLDHISPDQALEYDTLQLSSATNLALVGDLTDRPFTELQQLNPALLRGTAPAGYELRLPKGTAAQLTAALDKVPEEVRISSRIHRVEAGENLAAIAHRYNSSPKAIASLNSLADTEPAPGDQIVIPAAYREMTAAPVRAATARTARGTRIAASRKPTKSTGAPVRVTASKVTPHRTAGVIAQVAHKPLAVNR
jgi:membrane-bound lytic murein transglycosylase D